MYYIYTELNCLNLSKDECIVGLFGSALYKKDSDFSNGNDFDCFLILPSYRYSEAQKIYERICNNTFNWQNIENNNTPYFLYEQIESKKKGFLFSLYIMTMDLVEFALEKSIDFIEKEIILNYYRQTPRKREASFPTFTFSREMYKFPLNPIFLEDLKLWKQEMPTLFSVEDKLYIGVFIEHFLTAIYFGNSIKIDQFKNKLKSLLSIYKKQFYDKNKISLDSNILLQHLNVFDNITEEYKVKLLKKLSEYLDE